jgi:hypothetical protein
MEKEVITKVINRLIHTILLVYLFVVRSASEWWTGPTKYTINNSFSCLFIALLIYLMNKFNRTNKDSTDIANFDTWLMIICSMFLLAIFIIKKYLLLQI